MKTRITHPLILAVLSILMPAVSVFAIPPAETREQYAKMLNERVAFDFIETPLEKAMEHLNRKVKGQIILDYKRIGMKTNQGITLRVDNMRLGSALGWLCRLAGVDYDIRNNSVFITSHEEALRPYLKMKIYDVRSIVLGVYDYPAPRISTHNYAEYGGRGGYGDEGIDSEVVISMIRKGVYPWNWNVPGVRISGSAGLLMVVNTEDVHQQITKILDGLQRQYGKMVSFDVRFASARPEVLDKIMEDKQVVLDPRQTAAMLALIDKGDKGIAVEGVTRMACFNTQRVSLVSAVQQSYMRDVTPVVASMTGGLDPEIDTMNSGIVFDVAPSVGFDNAWTSLNITCSQVSGDEGTSITVPIASNIPSDLSPATKINLPSEDRAGFKTSVRVPNGGGVLLSGFSNEFSHNINGNGRVIFMVIQATIIE